MAQANPSPSPVEMTQLEIRKGADAELSVGGLRLVACRREVGDIDGGITLYVWSGGSGEAGTSGTRTARDGERPRDEPVELVRMDLFRARPHYHAPAEKQEESTIDAPAGGSVAWGITALTTRAASLVAEAGFPSIATHLDTRALAQAGPALQALFDGLAEPTEISYFPVPASVVASLRGQATG